MSPMIEGGSFCGAVRYRSTSRPSLSLLCHCRSCRRISGAPVVGWVTFASGHFAFAKGEPVRWASSPGVSRGFCNRCGTPLTYQREDESGEIDVTTCSLDDPAAFPPTHHTWCSHAVAWLHADDDLPKFQRSRRDG